LVHELPGQQSASLVHAPHAAMHCVPLQTKVGVPPAGFGTQGAPLQQSALDAQPAPAIRHCASAHRGTPTLSCLQVSWFSQLPLQQSHEALHDIVFSLQTSPLGLHPGGFWQTPTPLLTLQVTGPPIGWLGIPADPQQSLSFVQRSPTGWQPLAGWQTRTPVGPQGAQARLQQPPPHRGMPPST
jgi:hypothetical protein